MALSRSRNANLRVLVIDDDANLGELLAEYLARFKMTVESHSDPEVGLKAFQERNHDVVVLDIMMPKIDGFEVCRRIRCFSSVPVLMLTARGETDDKVVGLEIGADDYLSKPFDPRELAARLQALLRRPAGATTDSEAGGLRLNYRTGRGYRDDGVSGEIDLHLTETEFSVLAELVKQRPEPVSRDRLFEFMHGFEREVNNRAIDLLISRLRHKLDDNHGEPRYIRTVRLIGYAFIA